jgi:hypothetical protein
MTVSFHKVLLKPDRQVRRSRVGIWRFLSSNSKDPREIALALLVYTCSRTPTE